LLKLHTQTPISKANAPYAFQSIFPVSFHHARAQVSCSDGRQTEWLGQQTGTTTSTQAVAQLRAPKGFHIAGFFGSCSNRNGFDSLGCYFRGLPDTFQLAPSSAPAANDAEDNAGFFHVLRVADQQCNVLRVMGADRWVCAEEGEQTFFFNFSLGWFREKLIHGCCGAGTMVTGSGLKRMDVNSCLTKPSSKR